MFNEKLKKRIIQLETKVVDTELLLKKALEENNKLNWKLHNSPKYQEGETVGDLIILKRYVGNVNFKADVPNGIANIITSGMVSALIYFKRNSLSQKDLNLIAASFEQTWIYQLIDVNTREKFVKTEKELFNYLKK